MDPKEKRPTCLSEFLEEEIDQDYFEWFESYDEISTACEEEWAKTLMELKALGFDE
jgi:hypothetical protein